MLHQLLFHACIIAKLQSTWTALVGLQRVPQAALGALHPRTNDTSEGYQYQL